MCTKYSTNFIDQRKILTYHTQSVRDNPAPFSTISPKSSSHLDTDQGEIINEMLRKVLHRCLIKLDWLAIAGNPTINLDLNNVPHENTLDRGSAPTLNTNDIEKQTIPPQKDSYNL